MCKFLCLPLICLRWLVIVTGILILGLGGLMVWLGESLRKDDIMKGIDSVYVGDVIIAFGAWVLVVGLLGVLGAYFRNVCALWIYAKCLLTTSLVLMAFGALGLHFSQKLSTALDNPSDCLGNSYLNDANDAVVAANNQICHSACPCNATATAFPALEYANLTLGSPTRIQDCTPCNSQSPQMESLKIQSGYCLAHSTDSKTYLNAFFSTTEQRYFALIAYIEDQYNCAGICVNTQFFAFTNINKGPPPKNCRVDLQDWVQAMPLRYSAVVLSIGLLFFFSVISAYCITCNPRRATFSGYESPSENKI